MRADRLISALMLLQSKGSVTAAELASELEVSVRTARRDLEALAMSGVPLYSQAGRGGGWRLVGGARTDLTGLSSAEAQALFLALGQQASNPVLDAALRKLLVALPDRFRTSAAAASEAIRVDPAGWSKVGQAEQTPFVDELSTAVVAGRQVVLRYARPNAEPTDRVVHPLGLVTKRGVWYLVANTNRGIRTFRLSRVHAVERREEPVERPEGFDLDEAWEAIVTEVGEKMAGVAVKAIVAAEMVRPVQYVFAHRAEMLEELPDTSVLMRIRDATPLTLAAQLAGFGASIRLVDPPSDVVFEMQRIAAELASVWGADSGAPQEA